MKQMRNEVRAMRMCHQTGRWLQHFLDGEVTFATSVEVEAHLLICVRCGMEFETFARIQAALRSAPREAAFLVEDEVALERLRRFAAQLVGANGLGGD